MCFFSLPSLFMHHFFGWVVHIYILLPLFKFHFGPNIPYYMRVFIPSLIGKLHLKLIREEVLFEIDHIGHYPFLFLFFMIYNNFAKKTIKPSIIGYFLPNSFNRIITTIFKANIRYFMFWALESNHTNKLIKTESSPTCTTLYRSNCTNWKS